MTRPASCWATVPDPTYPAAECGAELEWRDGRWHCPHGHRLRQRLSPWLRDHIRAVQGDPTMLRRYFGDPP